MSFQDPHLAESIGYANGHANGLQVGRAAGHTEGWNEATIHANGVIAERDRLAERLSADNQLLANENRRLKDQLHLMQEQALSVRGDYENMLKAFFGVVAIATPAITRIAQLPLTERDSLVMSYAKFAKKFQGNEYVAEHGYPHNQPLIKKYLPIATAVIGITVNEMEASDKASKQNDKNASPA